MTGDAFLLSGGELELLAAASGMKAFLTFGGGDAADRARHYRTMGRLISEGIFVQEGPALRAGEDAAPFIRAFKGARSAAVCRGVQEQAPPVCVYCGGEDAFLCIAPHMAREDLFSLRLCGGSGLAEELTALGLLPGAGREEDGGPDDPARDRELSEKLRGMERPWDSAAWETAFGDELLSVTEIYRLPGEKAAAKLFLFRAGCSWYEAAVTEESCEVAGYRADRVISRIGGICS